MCLLIGLYLWKKHGGRLVIIFQPFPHVVVFCRDGLCRHGTHKTGRWSIEILEMHKFKRWFFKS